MVANGVSFLSTGILFMMLAAIGSLYVWTAPKITLGLLAIKVSFTLAILSLGWVLIVSHESWWRWAVVLPLLTFGLWAISNFTETSKQLPDAENEHYVLVLLVASALILIIRSWIHFFPMFIALGICLALVRMPQSRRFPVLANAIAIVISFSGSIWSRLLLSSAEIRVWMTYDQQFRASLATSLTRWGWTNWNAAPGQKIRYHWLSEAMAGVISRITMMDEFDAVIRVMPILGITAIVTVAVHLLRRLGVTKLISLAITIPVVGLHSALEVFSIGTLWGGFWLIATMYLLYASWDPTPTLADRLPRELVVILMIVAALLTQSTAGMTLGIVTGFVYLVQCLVKFRSKSNVVVVGVALASVAFVIAQTILRSGDSSSSADLRNFLREGWRFFPADVLLTSLLAIALYRKLIAIRYVLLPVLCVVTAMVLSNTVRIGGYEGRLLSEAQLVVSLFALGVVVRHPLQLTLFKPARYLYSAVPNRATTLLSVAICVLYLSYTYTEGARRNWEFSTRQIGPLEDVHGDRNVNTCMNWIRNETAVDSLVASNMWRTPGSEDQKYFLVSLKTKRQVLVDGPTYVANNGAYGDPSVLENRKNLIDHFVWSPTLNRLSEMKQLGVDVLLVDETRRHSARIGSFASTVIVNSRCSVYVL
jgi:hypothetical protein